jgi:hypothetical protein
VTDDDATRGRPTGEHDAHPVTSEAIQGWPTGEHNPYLVEGTIEQYGKLAEGLRHNRPGRRRALRLALWLAVFLGTLLLATLIWPASPR